MTSPTVARIGAIVISALATAGISGCVTPLGLQVLDVAARDPAAVESSAGDLLGAYEAARESLVHTTERSILKPAGGARTNLTVAQVQAVPAPAASADRQPELLPIGPPPAAASGSGRTAQQEGGQLGVQQPIKPIQAISLDIRAPQLVNDQQQVMQPPLDEAATALPVLAQERPFTRGDLAQSGYHWQPSPAGLTFCHQPTYFQEVNVERYGRSFGMFQPVVSVASFYGRVPLLPYMVFARPARRCVDEPHWALPGYRIPEWEPHSFVPSFAGSSAEVATIAGLILLIP